MQQQNQLSHEQILSRLELPSRPVRAVLDTDTYNEIDDQFALTYALLNRDQIALEAIHAAPFLNRRSTSAADGMERSYAEIQKILELLDATARVPVERGAERFIGVEGEPVMSPAVRDLIARSRTQGDAPLYVVSIAAPTNVASAILVDPSIASRIVVVWLGGHPVQNKDAREFNLRQDLAASRTLFESGVPLICIPCKQVAELLCTTIPELAANLQGKSKIGDYLTKISSEYISELPGSSRPIWDLSAVALLANPGWFESAIISSPTITDDFKWQQTEGRHPVRMVTYLKRDEIFRSFYATLNAKSGLDSGSDLSPGS